MHGVFFCTFGGDLHMLRSVLVNRISASELSRKLIKKRCWLGTNTTRVHITHSKNTAEASIREGGF